MIRIWPLVAITVLALLLGGARWLLPERPMDYIGPLAILDAAFAVGLLSWVLLLAGGLGWKVQRWLRLEPLTRLEQVAFAVPVGMGILAYGVLALGLTGLLCPWAILMWLIVATAWAWPEWSDVIQGFPRRLAQTHQALTKLGWGAKALLIVGALVLALATLQALTPPFDYDSLMYHLQGPRLFLEAGRILLLPDIWQANGPFTVEMLFTIGLALGSDTFAKLIHLSYAVFLVLATFGLGRRFIGPAGGWTAAALLLGIPALPLWASWSHVDIVQALYEFLGLYALLVWQENDQRRWLILAGLLTGWAVGSKYLALGGLAVLGLWTLWQSLGKGWKRPLTQGLLFGLPVLLVGSPWYAKNWLWSGNPVYPFVFGGTGWDADRLRLLMAYLRSFSIGRHFAQIPVLSFLLALPYPLTRRHRSMDGVASMTVLRLILWALASQQTRFLVPLFPTLSLLAANVLIHLAILPRFQRWGKALGTILLAGAVMITLLFNGYLFRTFSPLGVILGRESKDAFLRRTVPDYAGLQFVQRYLPCHTHALMMWDGRGYYCDARCIVHTDQSKWTRLVIPGSDPAAIAARLRAMGVTHLFFNVEDASFFVDHDPTGRHYAALEFFEKDFRPSCTREIYRDQVVLLFEVTCR
jgi:hypothetical protein